MQQEIRHIFFDVGDTLRIAQKIPEHMLAAKQRAAALLGTDMDPEEFAAMLDERYEGYRNDATVTWVELNEEDLWTKWLTPDFPEELVRPLAVELTFLFRQFRGRRELADHAVEVIQTLTARNYRLGIISNVITSNELPDWLDEDGLTPYFSPVVLSSLTGIRKPDPRIFELALEEAGIEAKYCAYVGDNVERDMGGAKKVGFGLNILIDRKHAVDLNSFTDATRPDAVIYATRELLDIFPAYPQVNSNSSHMLP
ncbi:HAD family hydrolase [Christensenellaceae bacterium OttesenSCG-928-L17]|nr:HAD family hydrolase [Christensenellaceae bacterium OttesenSCG-928-L17]